MLAADASLLSHFSRVLVLAAHTDDEFGCAGTIARLVDAGAQVRYLALSRCEASVPEGLPLDVLERECRACTALLGLADADVEVDRFPVRYFPRDRQEVLERFVGLARSYAPDLVLLPSSYDTHQDHAVVYAEGFRAFKRSTLLGYELPQNLTTFDNSAFVALDEDLMARKLSALSAYSSQQFRPYATDAFIRGLATVRGVQCGADFAEAFEVVRLIVN